ncbi:MAG: carbonic anhydrase [Candidatus Eremiobacteraeota bacterium]|nr:carbonic anhydrase [Candidatus Eremiobacteraeota bacterium]
MANTPALHEGIKRLLEGNARFVLGKSDRSMAADRLAELAGGQKPFATVLGCSDSRVPVETIFDQQPGDLFVVRIAGNYAAPDTLASIEFGTTVLGTRLLLVLGHSSCGAVTAAIEYVRTERPAPGHMQHIIQAVQGSARATQDNEDWLHAAVAENVRRNVKAVRDDSDIIADTAANGALTIAGAVYDLRSGVVSLLE